MHIFPTTHKRRKPLGEILLPLINQLREVDHWVYTMKVKGHFFRENMAMLKEALTKEFMMVDRTYRSKVALNTPMNLRKALRLIDHNLILEAKAENGFPAFHLFRTSGYRDSFVLETYYKSPHVKTTDPRFVRVDGHMGDQILLDLSHFREDVRKVLEEIVNTSELYEATDRTLTNVARVLRYHEHEDQLPVLLLHDYGILNIPQILTVLRILYGLQFKYYEGMALDEHTIMFFNQIYGDSDLFQYLLKMDRLDDRKRRELTTKARSWYGPFLEQLDVQLSQSVFMNKDESIELRGVLMGHYKRMDWVAEYAHFNPQVTEVTLEEMAKRIYEQVMNI